VCLCFCPLQQDCPNGRLTPAKFVDMYKMFFPSGNAEEFCDHVFRTFDMDKNGYIDFKVSSFYCVCVCLHGSLFLVYFGLWRLLVWYIDSVISEGPSTTTSHPEDGGNRFLRSVGTSQTTGRNIPEDILILPCTLVPTFRTNPLCTRVTELAGFPVTSVSYPTTRQ